MKNILFISHRDKIIGGGEYSLAEITCNLPSELFKVHLITSGGEDQIKLYFDAKVEHTVISLPVVKPGNLPQILKGFYKLLLFLKRNKIDLIHANTSRAMFYGGLVGKILNIPVIWHVRIADKDFPLDEINARFATKIIAISKYVGRRFKSEFNNKIQILYNTINPELFKKEGDMVEVPVIKRIIHIGQFIEQKGHLDFLKLAEKIGKDFPEVVWELYGKVQEDLKSYFQQVERESERLKNLGFKVFIRPFTEDKSQLYQNNSLLLHTSINEGFGRTIIEAFAAGIPVIAYNSGAVSEIMEEFFSESLVEPGNLIVFEEIIRKFLERKVNISELIEKGYFLVNNNFSTEKMIKELVLIYEEVINKGKKHG